MAGRYQHQVGICKRCGAENPLGTVECWKCKGSFSYDPKKVRTESVAGELPTSATRDAGTRKGRFCTECGVELEAMHKFCWNCGHSQTERVQVDEPMWETCHIECEVAKLGGFLARTTARWWAKATGPRGTYRAGESRPFTASVIGQEISIPDQTNLSTYFPSALAALNALASKLVADGWEATGTYGGSYWTKQYRRRIE